MLLFSGMTVNFKVWGHSHIWPSRATGTVHHKFQTARTPYFLWVRDGYTQFWCRALYQPRFLPALPQLLLNQFLRLPAFTCGFGITTQRYNSEFHSCLLKSSINPGGAVWYKMWRRKGVQVNEHLCWHNFHTWGLLRGEAGNRAPEAP